MAKRNTLKQEYYKETGGHWKFYDKTTATPTMDYTNWLEDKLVKKLNIVDVSKPLDGELQKHLNEFSKTQGTKQPTNLKTNIK